ncbi:hypothetical protein ACFWVP_20010 [Streptomyces sp. NPDC058637]
MSVAGEEARELPVTGQRRMSSEAYAALDTGLVVECSRGRAVTAR